MQVWGCALNAGARIDSFGLKPNCGWRPDLDALERLATPATKLIAITNPNNPVGTVLTPQVLMFSDACQNLGDVSARLLLCSRRLCASASCPRSHKLEPNTPADDTHMFLVCWV
jgi:Aminotransferase class I and II